MIRKRDTIKDEQSNFRQRLMINKTHRYLARISYDKKENSYKFFSVKKYMYPKKYLSFLKII